MDNNQTINKRIRRITMISNESIEKSIKECLEGEHKELFQGLFSKIVEMENKMTDSAPFELEYDTETGKIILKIDANRYKSKKMDILASSKGFQDSNVELNGKLIKVSFNIGTMIR